MRDPRELLIREFPDLTINSIEPLGEGWDHMAYLVNGELVFRLPWGLVEEGVDAAQSVDEEPEIALLRAVGGLLPVAVPEPVLIAREGSFYGYPYLPGRAVAETFDRSQPRAMTTLAELVVDVAVAIEDAVSLEAATGMGLERFPDARHDTATAWAALETPLVPAEVRTVAESLIASHAERWAAAAERKIAVLHADFGLDHWLVDERGDVYALIDWSDACVAPPEHQVSTLMWDVPELVGVVEERYASRTGHQLDADLVVADGCVNALGDLAELLADGSAEDDPDVRRCLTFLDVWCRHRPPNST